jgi:hypothetical protein
MARLNMWQAHRACMLYQHGLTPVEIALHLEVSVVEVVEAIEAEAARRPKYDVGEADKEEVA